MGDISTGELTYLLHGCLRTVDVFKDDGAWVVLDEGCNFCCHGKAGALNAHGTFEKVGSYPKCVHRQRKTYSGIGGLAGSETT
eukprot:4495310-Pyramimonas_sp.AAC.1